jgi:hypothetical protein
VYRGLDATNPGAFRFDPPEGKDWLGGLSVFEILYANYKHQLPFVISYKGEKIPYETTGVVAGLLKDGSTFLSGGIALYTPEHGNPAIGAEHWSIIVANLSKEDLKKLFSDFAKAYFGK